MSDRCKTYVLNLDRSVARWERISAALAAQGIEPLRVPAVDGRAIDLAQVADDAACRREMGRSLQPGEVGCFLSHLRALEAFLATGDAHAVVLEDDAVPAPGFAAAVEALCARLGAAPPLGAEAVNLDPSDYKYTTLAERVGETGLLCAHRFPMLASGVLWTRAGAARALAGARPVRRPWDNHLRLVLTGGNRGFSVRPPLVTVPEGPSDIQAASLTARRSRLNRSRWYFLLKQRRILREKARALAGLLRWRAGARARS